MSSADSFIFLFGGYEHVKQIGAFGTGAGEWVKRPLEPKDVEDHLAGVGPGIGIGPLGPGNVVSFAAIDLDEPDFAAAEEMQEYIPGKSYIERSRSGNAHIWVFFQTPVAAWVPMGILKDACRSAGKPRVEVFPKNWDWSRVKYGNYINLPFHGDSRPIIVRPYEAEFAEWGRQAWVNDVYAQGLQDPAKWHERARWLMLENPAQKRMDRRGPSGHLHMCADYLIEHRDDNPVMAGHRATVYFSLAKMLTNWELCDHDEALMYMSLVNDASPDRVPEQELRRILENARRGGFTSTGCDDPTFLPYAHPDCPIAKGA